jgi:hypothetical protein
VNRATLEDALVYPWDDGRAGTTIVFGGIVTLLSPLLIPALIVLGFGVQVIEAVLSEESGVPEIDSLAATMLLGVKAAIVLLCYVLLPFLVGFVLCAFTLGAFGNRYIGGLDGVLVTVGELQTAGGLLLLAGLLLSALLLTLWYVAPAALVRLARTRRLRDAFAFGAVRRLAGSDAYASAWLLGVVVVAVTGIILTVLSLSSVGLPLGAFVSFYAFVAVAYLYGRGARSAGLAEATPEDSTASAAADESEETAKSDETVEFDEPDESDETDPTDDG